MNRNYTAFVGSLLPPALAKHRLGMLLASSLVLMSPAFASVADSTTATYLVLPTNTQVQLSLKGHSTTIPSMIQDFVHPEARREADCWYWDQGPISDTTTLIYGGWNQGRLINVLHFTINGNRLTFVRQYRLKYSNLADNVEVVTVDRFNANGLKEELDGHTEYTYKIIDNKRYLLSAERVGVNTNDHYKLLFSWSASGVKTVLLRENGTQAIDLQASRPWIKKHFDLWRDRGI
jgi:hypothetical protein